jgi:hypothetical protein
VRAFDLIAKRRTPKHPLLGAGSEEIREIRMAVRELKDRQFSDDSDMIA